MPATAASVTWADEVPIHLGQVCINSGSFTATATNEHSFGTNLDQVDFVQCNRNDSPAPPLTFGVSGGNVTVYGCELGADYVVFIKGR